MTFMYHTVCRNSSWEAGKGCFMLGCGFYHTNTWQQPHDHLDHAKHPNGFCGILYPLPAHEDAAALAAVDAADLKRHVRHNCSIHNRPRSASALIDDGKGGFCCQTP